MKSDPRIEALERENRRLKRAIDEVSLLNQLAVEIGTLRSSERIVETLVQRSLKALQASQGVVTLIDGGPDGPALRTYVRARDERSSGRYHLDPALLGWMQIQRKPVVVSSPDDDPRFPGVDWDPAIRSLLAAPLMIKSSLKAVLAVYNKRDGGFTPDDERLLAIIASQSAQALENARLAEQEEALRKVEEEMRLAAHIQKNLLPAAPPRLAGYDVAGRSRAAREVGGDHFDFLELGAGRVGICLGDVSGKGLPASLLMANLQATVRAQADRGASPAECVRRANRLLCRSSGLSKFVTFFYAELDLSAHRLTFANAGHNPPMLFSVDSELARLEAGGPVLGVLPDADFEQDTIGLARGDLLIIFSDGVTEALAPDEEEFGDGRLAQTVRARQGATAQDVLEEVFAAVEAHAAGTPQNDDITVVVVRRH